MAFGIGVYTTQPEGGSLKGRQEDVACDCWFTSTGKGIPRLVKYQDSEGMIHCLDNICVREIKKLRRCGIPVVEYRCSTICQDIEYYFRLLFHMEACQWKMTWESSRELAGSEAQKKK